MAKDLVIKRHVMPHKYHLLLSAALLLMDGIESGDQKKVPQFYCNFAAIYRNFFRLGGPQPPLPLGQSAKGDSPGSRGGSRADPNQHMKHSFALVW